MIFSNFGFFVDNVSLAGEERETAKRQALCALTLTQERG
jgi:hypothetical protein